MKEILIEELAYLIKEAKRHNHPQPIFFLGAGASVTGNIPLANKISEQILKDYASNPFVKKLAPENQNYANLMECLLPNQRNELLKKYINEAKINVTHIYLAQLLKEGFADYVLTVNFDNLMLRALALYNIFPPTYDLAILKDLTTTTFNETSVVYLHGQHHGLWLLNTEDEMAKVKATVQRIFDSIKNKRPWVFIGYSGSDPIFEHVKNLGRYDNGLYWVGYKEQTPAQAVLEFLNEPNTNSFHINGYDADAFMLKLNEELELPQPEILSKPFSSLERMLSEIKDINDEDHFKGVKERLEISRKNVKTSIKQFEERKLEDSSHLKKEMSIDALKQEIIKLSITETYQEEQILNIHKRAQKMRDDSVNELLSDLYFNWAFHLGGQAEKLKGKKADDLYDKVFEIYTRATEINSNRADLYYNWGTDLGEFGNTKSGKEAEKLYLLSFEKLEKAVSLDANDEASYYNWGVYLTNLALSQTPNKAIVFYEEALQKFQKAIQLSPHDHEAFNNWGTCLRSLAGISKGRRSEELYKQASDKYKKSTQIDNNDPEVFLNWGVSLSNWALSKVGVEAKDLHMQALEKFKKVIDLEPKNYNGFNHMGISLGNLARIESDKRAEELYSLSFKNFKKAIEIKPDSHQVFYNWGNNLGLLAEIKKSEEANTLYSESFEMYKKAIEFKPDFREAFYNWGFNLMIFAKSQSSSEAEMIYDKATRILTKAVDLGSHVYNLACIHAIKKSKLDAFSLLNQSLENQEISIDHALNDEDWQPYLEDEDFKAIIEKHKEK